MISRGARIGRHEAPKLELVCYAGPVIGPVLLGTSGRQDALNWPAHWLAIDAGGSRRALEDLL
jgi:hypothetical protein